MTTILNPWKGHSFQVRKPRFTYKDCAIYKLFEKAYLHVHKNRAFSLLAGLNKDHLISVADRKRPQDSFLYDEALENLERS